jgi:hypothetical protein
MAKIGRYPSTNDATASTSDATAEAPVDPNMVTLLSSDLVEFVVDRKAAELSAIVKELV